MTSCFRQRVNDNTFHLASRFPLPDLVGHLDCYSSKSCFSAKILGPRITLIDAN
jgi:hypothetical protein